MSISGTATTSEVIVVGYDAFVEALRIAKTAHIETTLEDGTPIKGVLEIESYVTEARNTRIRVLGNYVLTDSGDEIRLKRVFIPHDASFTLNDHHQLVCHDAQSGLKFSI